MRAPRSSWGVATALAVLVRVVLVSSASGAQTDLGNWPRVYELHEEGEPVELYVMDMDGHHCVLGVRGDGGGWVPTSSSTDRSEHYAKFYGTEDPPSSCPPSEEER